jgi:hypothetical protein
MPIRNIQEDKELLLKVIKEYVNPGGLFTEGIPAAINLGQQGLTNTGNLGEELIRVTNPAYHLYSNSSNPESQLDPSKSAERTATVTSTRPDKAEEEKTADYWRNFGREKPPGTPPPTPIGTDEAPDGSGALGMQLNKGRPRPSHDDVMAMWAATGALPYARPYGSTALPGTLAGERQLNPYDSEERVVLQEDPTAVYRELYPDQTIYDHQQPSPYDTYEEGELPEDPAAAYRKEFPNRKVVNADDLRQKKGDKKQSKEPSGRNWMKPRSMGDKTYGELRREILLGESSGPEAMRQLDALRGYVKSGSDRYKIPENYKSGMQLGPKLTDEEYQGVIARERSQEFLNQTLSQLKETPAKRQNPVVSNNPLDQKVDSSEHTDNMAVDFRENNLFPKDVRLEEGIDKIPEVNKRFNPMNWA